MKKIITIMIGCSLALAAGAMAQQEDAEASPGKKKQQQKAEAREEGQAPSGQQQAERPQSATKGKAQRAERRNARAEAKAEQSGGANAEVNAQANTTSDADTQPGKQRKGRKAKADMNSESATATTADVNAEPGTQKKGRKAKAEMRNQATTSTEAGVDAQAQTAAPANQPKQGKMKGNAKQVDVKAIKAQHANFKAQPKPQQVPAVTFNQSYRIEGASQWQGQQYSVFRSYQPQQHDQAYYRSRYSRIELIGGGYYYFDGGYWYPAWGYQPSAQYYVYNGPIYAGQSAERLDQVIANVQAVLQAQGYYKGEVDGLLGPLTREALNGYQTEHGLYTTGTIDQPTLSSLGMS